MDPTPIEVNNKILEDIIEDHTFTSPTKIIGEKRERLSEVCGSYLANPEKSFKQRKIDVPNEYDLLDKKLASLEKLLTMLLSRVESIENRLNNFKYI